MTAWEDIGCYKDAWARALDGELHKYINGLTREMCVGMCTESVSTNKIYLTAFISLIPFLLKIKWLCLRKAKPLLLHYR